jgi:hypothetical protein
MEYPTAMTVTDLRRNLETIRQRIIVACAHVSRDPDEIRLLSVSKTVDVARLRLAYAASCREMGENKMQETRRKAQAMGDLSARRWSMNRHLQTNKAKYVARFASECQTLDDHSVPCA